MLINIRGEKGNASNLSVLGAVRKFLHFPKSGRAIFTGKLIVTKRKGRVLNIKSAELF